MTLEEFIQTNPNIMPDGPLNKVFGPSGMMEIFNLNKDKENRIMIWYFHNFGTYHSLCSIVVDNKGVLLEKNWYERKISRN
jgi:hypothetical protein